MTHKESESLSFDFYPLTPERWSDLQKLFGKNGACGGCWCMWWRIPRAQFSRQKGQENQNALRSIVNSGEIPGLLAYSENQPIGWCAVAPRERYQSLEHSRILRKVDNTPVWSVVCFFVAKAFRHKGVTVKLLEAAI
jgi:GNAT superfamily N-acetyltransferase